MQSTQARHLQQWVEDQVPIYDPITDDLEKWMDKIGRVIIYLAFITGTATIIIQIVFKIGWW